MREEVEELKKEVNDIKKEEESFAMELLKDQRKQNKRLFIVIITILCMWFVTIGYLVYLLNDIEVVETTESIDVTQDSGDNGNNNFINGDSNEVNNG